MSTYIKTTIYLFIIITTTLFASQKQTDNISSISATSLYNINKTALQNTIKAYIKSNPNLKALKIVEALSGETYISIYRDEKGDFLEGKLPTNLDKLESYKSISKYENENVGEVFTYFTKTSKGIKLSVQERKWIKTHPIIHVGGEMDWPPFDYVDDKGHYAGIAKEYLQKVTQQTGIKFEYITGMTWNEILEAFKAKKFDLLPALYHTEKRANYLNFTNSYTNVSNYLFVRENDNTFKSIDDIANKRIAVTKGYKIAEELNRIYPSAIPIEVANIAEGLDAVITNKADGFIDSIYVVQYTLDKNLISGLKPIAKVGTSEKIYMGAQKEYEPLIGIINKVFATIDDKQRASIYKQWSIVVEKKKVNNIALTKDEQKWIKNNTIKVGVEHWTPIIFSNTGNDIDGVTGDILKLIVQRTGLKIDIVNDLWDPLLKGFKNKTIDLLPATYYTKERATYGLYSSGFFKSVDYIYVKEGNKDIKSISDLNGKKLAIQKGYGTIPKVKEKFPNIEIVPTIDLRDSISRVLSGEVDALFESQVSVEHMLQDELIFGIKGMYQDDLEASPLHFFSRDDKPILQSILQKGLNTITKEEMNDIKSKWMGNKKTKNLFLKKLSKKEKEFIKNNPELKIISGPAWAPFDFVDKNSGEHHGIGHDYFQEISNITGIKFNHVHTNSWNDSIEKIKAKKADIFTCAKQTPQRDKFLNFTNTYITYPIVIATSNHAPFIASINDIKDKKIALIKGFAITEILNKDYPNLNVVLVKSAKEALQLVSNGEAFAFLGSLGTVSYTIKEEGLFNLKIAGLTEYKFSWGAAIRNDLPPELLSIVNKAFDSIPIERKNEIYNKWVSLEFDEHIDYTIIYQILGVFLLFVIATIYWNRKIASANEKVKDQQQQFESMVSNVPGVIYRCKVDDEWTMFYISSEIEKLSGYPVSDFINNSVRSFADIMYEEDIEPVAELIQNQIDKDEKFLTDYRVIDKKGVVKWVRSQGQATKSGDGSLWLDGVLVDVTEQKKLQKEIEENRLFLNTLLDSQEQIIVTTDGKKIVTANKTFLDFFEINELNEFEDNCICDRFNLDSPKDYLQKEMDGMTWVDYILHNQHVTHKAMITVNDVDNIFSVTAASLPIQDNKYDSVVFTNITELERVRKDIELILSNILLPILITSKEDKKILYANKYAQRQYEKPLEEIIGSDIDDVYTVINQNEDVIKQLKQKGFIENSEEIFKIHTGKEFNALLSVTPLLYKDQDAYIGMVVDITKQKEIESQIREIHKHTKDSIEYASSIQQAIVPDNQLFYNYFDDFFTIWEPKDIVGGDIYLFEDLNRDDTECLLMVIDCTGHGVPGAFVTMLVKALERQVVAKINNDRYSDIDVSPAWILQYFNKNMKKLLKQESKESISNAGFDGQVIYYNKSKNILKSASARNEVFYVQDNELTTIKPNKHSIGYKDSNSEFVFKDTIINIDKDTTFYISSDGYWDQNGGEKEFCYGKRRLKSLILDNHNKSMSQQKEILIDSLHQYQGSHERNDDVTFVGFTVSVQEEIKKDDIIISISGIISQKTIDSLLDDLTIKFESIEGGARICSKISYMAIEQLQNILKYSSNNININNNNILSQGNFTVGYSQNKQKYYVSSSNEIEKEDMEKMITKFEYINSLDNVELKKHYKSLLREATDKHDRGAGIGIVDMARKSSEKIEYKFKKDKNDKDIFNILVYI